MDIITTLMGFPWVQTLGAVMTLMTALQALLLLVGKFVPGLSKAASVVGVVAVDIGKVVDFIKPLFGSKSPPQVKP